MRVRVRVEQELEASEEVWTSSGDEQAQGPLSSGRRNGRQDFLCRAQPLPEAPTDWPSLPCPLSSLWVPPPQRGLPFDPKCIHFLLLL